MLLINPAAKVILDRAAKPFPVAPPLEWVEEPDGYEPGWTYDGEFHPPPDKRAEREAEKLAELRAAAKQALLDEQLEGRLDDATAPEAVKAYAMARQARAAVQR